MKIEVRRTAKDEYMTISGSDHITMSEFKFNKKPPVKKRTLDGMVTVKRGIQHGINPPTLNLHFICNKDDPAQKLLESEQGSNNNLQFRVNCEGLNEFTFTGFLPRRKFAHYDGYFVIVCNSHYNADDDTMDKLFDGTYSYR